MVCATWQLSVHSDCSFWCKAGFAFNLVCMYGTLSFHIHLTSTLTRGVYRPLGVSSDKIFLRALLTSSVYRERPVTRFDDLFRCKSSVRCLRACNCSVRGVRFADISVGIYFTCKDVARARALIILDCYVTKSDVFLFLFRWFQHRQRGNRKQQTNKIQGQASIRRYRATECHCHRRSDSGAELLRQTSEWPRGE